MSIKKRKHKRNSYHLEQEKMEEKVKLKSLLRALVLFLAWNVQASDEGEEATKKVHVCQCSHRLAVEAQERREDAQKAPSQTEETYVTYEELCRSFKDVSHPDVFALFEEGFGVLFGHQEMRIPSKRENSHIKCLHEKFTLALEHDTDPMSSAAVKRAQMEALAKVFRVKGHEEWFSGDFLEKLQ
jgi:hypothetical protein